MSLGAVGLAGATPSDDSEAACDAPPPHDFTDVSPSAYYDTPVSWLLAAGITAGVTPDTYAPNMDVTRGQMAQFLWRNAGSPETEGPHGFADIPEGVFYSDAVSWLVESGITSGYAEGRYAPNNIVTRGEMAQFLWRFNDSPEAADNHSFYDVPTGAYYEDAVSWLVEVGITAGYSEGRYAPNLAVTRGQMATFLYSGTCDVVQFDSPATGTINIDVLLPGDPEADPPTEDEIIPVAIPVAGQAKGNWSQVGAGSFGVDLSIDSGTFPLTVPGLPELTVSYSIPENSSGAGHFDPTTGLGEFDVDIAVTVDEVDLLGPMEQPCGLEFGMTLDGGIDAGTGMLNATQTSFDVTPPAEADCGGLGDLFGDLLSGPDNSVSIEFMVGQF